MQQSTLHGLCIAVSAEALFQDALPLALEAARYPRSREQHIRLKNQDPCTAVI